MKGWVAAVVVVGACVSSSPAPRRATPAEIADRRGQSLGLAAIVANKDTAAVRRLLHGGVVDTSLWFDDAECARRFAGARLVPEAELDAFATCLAGLHVKASAHVHQLPNVAMLTYGPGIELEAWLLLGPGANQLVSIGFAADEDGAADVAVTPESLERLRVAGARVPSDPAARAVFDAERRALGSEGVGAGLKVCVDASGVVTRVVPYTAGSRAVRDAFVALIHGWRFQPFDLGGRPTAACTFEVLSYPERLHGPGTDELGPPPLDPALVGAPPLHRRSGTTSILPPTDVAMRLAPGTVLVGAVRLCTDADGHVDKLVLYESTGFPGYDEHILAEVHRWRYEPGAGCINVQLMYQQRALNGT